MHPEDLQGSLTIELPRIGLHCSADPGGVLRVRGKPRHIAGEGRRGGGGGGVSGSSSHGGPGPEAMIRKSRIQTPESCSLSYPNQSGLNFNVRT